MKKIFVTLALLLSTCFHGAISAQDLHIYLDARTDRENTLVYVLDGDTLSKPRVKQGRQIFFHVLNYNNYLYDLATAFRPSSAPFF